MESTPERIIPEDAGAYRILIIEDDTDAGNLLVETLGVEGYQVQLVTDGTQGQAAVSGFAPDLILLDVMMPSLDGLELCRRLRLDEATRSLPVLLLTAKGDLTDKIKGFQAGADDYITKPFVIRELLARIQSHLRIQQLKVELALSEERYRLLIENSPDAIILLSPNLEILFQNSKFSEVLRVKSPEPMTGRPLPTLFAYSDLFREIFEIVEKVRTSNSLTMKEVHISASNHNTIHLEILGMPVKTGRSGVAMFQVVFRNLTHRKRMEEAMLQAEKINALGTLTAGIAHEINNPLTGISNAIQILQKGGVQKKRQDELFNLVLSNIERIAGIVKDLRIFAQPHESAPALFPANEAVSEMANLARYQIRHQRIKMEIRPSSEPLLLFGDRYQFQQVILNLVVNAIQAIKNEGEVTVTVGRQETNCLITVDDTGCGIPANQMNRIFDPFFTTKRDWKGTGLGLAVSYRVVQLFRGSLTVQSTVGSGSRFMVSIPLARRGSPPA